MTTRVYGGFGRILPLELEAFRADIDALERLDGFVFLDPEDGVSPLHLAELVLRRYPSAEVVIPLVCRDANRTALLSTARTAEALGARGLLVLTGRLDSASKAKAVYDLDPQQLLGILGEAGLLLRRWVSSRWATAAEKARVASLAAAAASRCLVPWDGEDLKSDREGVILPVYSVPESHWAQGALPAGDWDLVLLIPSGRGSAVRAALESCRRFGGLP